MKDENCRLCKAEYTYLYLLEETQNFLVITDPYPILEGHIIIVSKDHISCVGDYSPQLLDEFIPLYDRVRGFVREEYGKVSSFEHGKLGQSIFHSHTHVLPFDGNPQEIVPEGLDKIVPIEGIAVLHQELQEKGMYLFFSIGDQSWLVDATLGFPRFFRNKFAVALNRPERSDWKHMEEDAELARAARGENGNLIDRWKARSGQEGLSQ
jgi:diadenosine tetraphosphate (Ap4A) HIT family hydrolase